MRVRKFSISRVLFLMDRQHRFSAFNEVACQALHEPYKILQIRLQLDLPCWVIINKIVILNGLDGIWVHNRSNEFLYNDSAERQEVQRFMRGNRSQWLYHDQFLNFNGSVPCCKPMHWWFLFLHPQICVCFIVVQPQRFFFPLKKVLKISYINSIFLGSQWCLNKRGILE